MSQSIAFIDASLAQNDLALENFSGQIYTIPFGKDGVQYISEVLKEHKNLDAVHLFSHGTEAALMLGNRVLNPETLQENAALLQSWQLALSPDADFLIYGCNVAAGETGEAFVEELSQLIGADVAASDDVTGGAQANWTLEFSNGVIEASTPKVSNPQSATLAFNYIYEDRPERDRVTGQDSYIKEDDTGLGEDQETLDIYPGFSDDLKARGSDWNDEGNLKFYLSSSLKLIAYEEDSFGGRRDYYQGRLWDFNEPNDDISGIRVFLNIDDDQEWVYGKNTGTTLDLEGGDDVGEAGGGNDTWRGGSGNDKLYGESGDDTLYGESGDDTLYGGSDDDTLYGGSDDDTLYGGSGGDTLDGGSGNNKLYAGDGASEDSSSAAHTITSGSGNDLIHGSRGTDTVNVSGGTNEIYTYSGNDSITTGGGVDTIESGSGNDTIKSGGGNDIITAGTGNDTVRTGTGDDTVDGGDGDDLITDDLDNGNGSGGNDTFYGEGGNDTLRGEEGDDKLYGGDGDDYLESGNGNDLLEGGAGNDTLVYGNVSNGDVGPHPDPNNGGAPTLNPNTRDLEEIKVTDGSNWRSASGETTVDGGTGLDTLKVVGEYSDFDIETETLADGNMRFTVTDRNNSSNRVVATNVEKIEFWNNYTVYPGDPTQRELHNRNGIILPVRYELDVLQDATEQLYGSKTELKDNNNVGQVKVQLKDWQNPTQDYVIEGDENEPGSKRDEYSLGNGLAIKYEIVVTGNFGPEETEFLSDKLRFKRINLETGRSTTVSGEGLDYVTENFVVVQPGESSAIINILPIVDEIQEGLESVEVRIVSMDRVDKIDGGAGTSAYVYQEGFLYPGIVAANGSGVQGTNNAENNIQDGVNKGYVLMPVSQTGDRVTVNIADSGLFQAGIRLVDEYGFQVGEEALLQEGAAEIFVGLTSRPAEAVTVNIAGQDYTFTSDRTTWNQLQSVNLTGSAGTTVTFDVTSTDPAYNALSDRTLTLVDEQSVLQVPEPVALQIGDGNYVQLPDISLSGDYAIELWVKPNAGPNANNGSGTLLQSDSGAFQLVNGQLQGTNAFSFIGNVNNQLEAEQWHRITLLSVDGRFDIYVDGNRAGSQTVGSNSGLILQSVGASEDGAQGLVSNLRFWDQLVSDGDLYVGTRQAQYNLDEGSGTALKNQAPAVSGGDAIVAFNNTDALLWTAGVPLADPALQEMLAEEATAFGLVNRNFDFPQVSVVIPSDQSRTVEGSDQLAAFELLLDKPAPRGGITVNFDLSNLTVAEDGALKPIDQIDQSGEAWQGVDFQITTTLEDGTSQIQDVGFGDRLSSALYIPAGARKGTVYVNALDDQRSEGNQTVQLSLTGISDADDSRYQVAAGQAGQGAIAILDTDRPGVEILSLQSSYTYNDETERAENVNRLAQVDRIIVREADDGALALRFNIDDLLWDGQTRQTAQLEITDTAGLTLSETSLSLTETQRFAVTTVYGDYANKTLSGTLTLDGVAQSFSVDLVENQALSDAEPLRLNPDAADLKKTFEQGHLITTVDGSSFPIRLRQSSWNEYVYVRLTSAPIDTSGQVAVDLSATESIVGTEEVLLSTDKLIFTAENWDQPQLVGIRGVNDGLNDPDQIGQITAKISLASGETTDQVYAFGGDRASLLYLNAALPAETVEITEEEQVQLYQPENPANPNYRFERNSPTGSFTITEGETAQVAIAADPSGQSNSLKGRYKVVEPGLTRSLRLTGGEDRLTLEQPIALGSNFTLQLAFRWDGTRDEGQPIQLVQAVNGHGDVFINNDGRLEVRFTSAQGQPVIIASGTPLLANEEYLINIATDGLNAQIFADGQLIGSGSLGAAAIAPVEVTSVFGAAEVSQVDNFRGVVYGARFWGKALSQTEVRRFSQAVLNPSPVLFTLDEANKQVSLRLNPDVVTEAPSGPIDLTFRRYSYTGSPEPEVSTVTITFDANNWQSDLALPFTFNNSQSLQTDIQQITVQVKSQSDQVQDFISNVGDAYALESLRSLYLIDEISPTALDRFERRPNFAEGGATQGLDFERLEGVTVKKGLSENLPISGDRYLGDRPALATGDLTGDGKADLLVLSEKSGAQFYENTSTDRELSFTQQQSNQPQVDTEIVSQGFSGSEARLVDADGDGDLDLVWSQDGGLKVILNEPTDGVAFAGSTEAIALVDQTGSALGSGTAGDLVGFDFADINQDGTLDAVVLDENNQLQTYLGNSSFNLTNGLVRLADENNPFRNVILPTGEPLALKFGDVINEGIADGMPELYVYERDGGDGSYWRFLMPETDGAEGIDVVYRDRTYLDPLTSRAGQIGDLESLAFLNKSGVNDSGVDGVFLSLDNARYRFGTIANRSNEIIFDYSDPQAGAGAVLDVVSLQDKTVELDERVRLQLVSTGDLTAESGLDRSIDIIIQDDDRPGVTLAYVSGNGEAASIVSSHLSPPDNAPRPLVEGQQSDGFYVLKLDSQPQETVGLVLRNSDSDRLQFERIYPFGLTVNADGSLTVRSRLADAPSDYSLSFKSSLVQTVSRDAQGGYQVQLDGATTGALQSAIANKSTSEIQQSVAVQNILKQISVRVDSDDPTYRVGLGLNANQLLQERISITPKEQMKLSILPGSWQQQILLRPVAPDNLADNQQDATPRLSIAIDSSDPVYSSLPGLLAELPITDSDQSGVIINQLDDIREGIDGGQFQVSLNSKPTGTVLITLEPSDLNGEASTAIALDSKYYGDTIELKFNQYNWNAPQTVKVRAQDDNVVTGDIQRFIQAKVRSDDANYAGIAVDPVTVTIRDNDLPAVSAYTVLDAAEPGQIGFFGIRLNTDQLRNPEGLKIHYRVRGWASAPASADDYQEYVNLTPEGENFITIAPGQDLGNVVIFPIDDYIAEGFDITFKPGAVDIDRNQITITTHRLVDGSKVVFTPEGSDGSIPSGLSNDSFYYVDSIDSNTIKLYRDATLSQEVDLTSGGIGEIRLLDATGKATVEEAKENTQRFEAVELELLSDPNGDDPGYRLADIDTQASVRIYDNEEVGFRFILPGQQVLDSSSPADKGYLTIAEHPEIDNTEEFSAAVFLVRPLSDPGKVQTGANAGQDNWTALRFNPRWDQNSAQEMQVHLAEEPKFEDDGTQTVTIAVYDQYGRKIEFYQRDPDIDDSASDELTTQLEISVTKDTWAEPIRLKSAVFFDLNGNGEWDDGEHRGVTLSDSSYFFDDTLDQLSVGKDNVGLDVTLADFDANKDGYLTLFETTQRDDQPDGWGIVSELGNAAAIAVQVGDDIGKVEIPGSTDVAVDHWNRFAVLTSFAADTADTEIKLVAEDGVPNGVALPTDYSGDPYASGDLWKQNAVYFDSNNWARFQSIKLTALDDKEYDIDRILPLEMKVYENEGNDGFYSKKFDNAQSPLVLTVKDRRLDNETVTGSLTNGFSELEKIINNYELPLVGSLSGKLPPFLTDFIRAFSRNLEQQRYITGPSLATALSDALNEQFDGTGFEVSIEYDADSQTISMSLAFGQDYDLFEIGLDSDLGIPALGLETEGSLASIFHFDLRVGIALNLKERSFTLDISEDENGTTNTGADANIYLDLNNFKATGNIAFLKAELEQIPLDDFINGHKPQLTIWLDEDSAVGETDQTVTVRAYDIGGSEIDLDLTSGNAFASYEKTEDNWKHPLILEGLDYDAIDEISVDFNDKTRRFRVDWTGEKDIQGLKIDARLFSQDPHAFFQEYDGDKDILGALEKNAESEGLLSKGDTHSEAALGVGFSLVGEKAVDVEIERKYAFAIETETEAQTIPDLYQGDKPVGTQALSDFLDDQGPQDGSVSIALEDIDNNSDAINLFTVELFKLVDPNRESFTASAEEDSDFFSGLKLDPINFTLGAATVDPDDPQPASPRLPLRRQLNTGGSSNSVLMRDVQGYAIDFSTGGDTGNIEQGSDIVFRVTKAQTSDGLPSGAFYYIQPFNEDKAIHQVVDYLVVSGPDPETEGAAPLEVSITNPDAADNVNKNELPDLFIIQEGENVKITGAQTQGALTRLEVPNAEGFEIVATGDTAAQDAYELTEVGVPVRGAEVGISELGSKAKELFDYTLSGSVGAAFNLVTSVAGNTSFPSLSMDLALAAQAEKSKDKAAELSLTVGLKDLGLDLGSFITKFAAPVIEAVDSVLDPIKPLIEALNQDSQFLEAIGLESQFDKDANGEASILEVALVLSEISKQVGEAKYAEFFETVVKVIDFIQTIEELAAKLENGDNLVIPLLDEYHLSLTPGGDEAAEGGSESGAKDSTALPKPATKTSGIQHQETKPDLPGTDGIGEKAAQSGNENASFFKKLVDKIQGIEGLRFPILEDPISLVNLLFGKDVNLVLYEVPDLKLELNPRVEFYPFPPYPVKGVLAGKFEVGAQLGFGYDTYGFRQWSEADFDLAESYQVFDGFFLTDWTLDSYLSNTGSGIDDKPELYATAEVEAGVEIGEGLTGYLGVGVGANVNFDLEDVGEYQDNLGTSDGKVRGSEIIAGISDPLSLFELYGRIYAFLRALVEIDLGLFNFTLYEQKWEYDLFKFQVGGAKQDGSAVQSEIVGATVFFDANFNLKFDEGEAWGMTLGDGSYSFDVDPAEFDVDGDGQLTLMDGQIVVIGGRDKESGLPIINPMIASPESSIVSPLTTLATQIAVSNGGDVEASSSQVKLFFNLPDTLDLGGFHPIEAIRSGSAEEAALGLQVYKSHIIIDSLIYNVSRVAGGYSEMGMTADLVIEVLEFVANELAEVTLDDNETFEDRLSGFAESVVADFYQEKILPALAGEALAEAEIEQTTVINVLSETYARVASAANVTGGSVEDVQQAFENLTPLKTSLKTDIPAALDQFQQGTISASETEQISQQTLSEISNKAPVVDGLQLFTSFDAYAGATVASIFNPTFVDDTGDSFYGIAIVGHTPQINLGYWAYYDSNKALWFTLDEPITSDSALVLEANTRLRFIPQPGADGAQTPNFAVRLIDQNGQAADARLQTGDRISFEGETAQPTGGISAYSATLLNFATTITLPESSMSDAPSLSQTTADIENLAFAWEDAIPTPQGASVASLFGQYFESSSIYNFYGIAIGDYKLSPAQGVWQYSTNEGDDWSDLPEINPEANSQQLLLTANTLLRFFPTVDYEGAATALSVNLIDSRVAGEGGFDSGDRKNIAIDLPNSYTEPLSFQTQVYGVNDAPISSLSVTFSQREAIRISDRKSATTADPSPAAGKGDLFPSVLSVQGLLGEIETISVKLNGLNVTADNNLDIWLEGPQGQTVILLSDAGNGTALSNFTITFSDSGVPALAGSSSGLINNSIYRPTNNAAGNADLDPSAFSTAATSFSQFVGQAGASLNGDWKLYVQDDTDSGVDAEKLGKLLNGWQITFNRVEGSFSPITEDSSAPQELTVSDLFGSRFTDVDSDSLKGVAVINNAATAAEGRWEYLSGENWSAIATNLTQTKALLLTAETKLRFIPAENFNGKPGSITGRLIDSSLPDFITGKVQDARFNTSGGPFSPKTISRTLTINPVNDAPSVVSEAEVTLPSFVEDTPFTTANAPTVETLFASAFQDTIDRNNLNQNTFIGIAIIQDFAANGENGAEDREAAAKIGYEKGQWEVYDIRNAQWVALPNDLSEDNAYLVPKTTQIRYKPNANYNGELPPIEAYLVDNGLGQALGLGQRINLSQTGVGGVTRYTATTVMLNGSIEAVNDLPPAANDLSAINLSDNGQDEDLAAPPTQSVAALFASRFGLQETLDGDQFGYDPADHSAFDDATFWGVLIKDVPDSEMGVWEYSANGVDWTAIAGWDEGSGLYLPQAYQLRFRQTMANYNDAMTGEDLGPAHLLTAYLVDGSITDTNVGAQLQVQAQPSSAIATANPTPNQPGEASPISTSSLTLQQAINAVNDAPKIAEVGDLLLDGTPVSAIIEDETGSVYLSGIAIADVDANEPNPDGQLIVTLSVESGILTLSPDIAGGLSASDIENNGTAELSLTGTLSAINTTLQATEALGYAAISNFNGTDTLAISVTDSGNAGQGGPLTAETTRTISITAINDAPTVAFETGTSPLSVDEDTVLYIEDLMIDDVDSQLNPEGNLVVTLSVSNGTLALAGPGLDELIENEPTDSLLSDVEITYSEEEDEVVLVGTLAAVQAVLQSGVAYQGNLNFSGEDAIAVSISDNGNTGEGVSELASTVRAISVRPVNDAPIATETTAFATLYEDGGNFSGERIDYLFGAYFDDRADALNPNSSVEDVFEDAISGIAIVSNNANPETEGIWQYTTDTGAEDGLWRNLPIDALSAANTIVLEASDRLRFLPVDGSTVTAASLGVHLVDDTAQIPTGELGINLTQTGQTTPFSEDLVTLSTRLLLDEAGNVGLIQTNRQVLAEEMLDEENGLLQTAIQFLDADLQANQFPGWELLAAETIEGENQLLWQNQAAQKFSLWTMDDTWRYVSSEEVDSEVLRASQLLALFEAGDDTSIENASSVELFKNSLNKLWVWEEGALEEGSTFIQFNGSLLNANQFPDWELLAAETIEGENQLLWQNQTAQQFSLWTMDDTWNYVSSEEFSAQTQGLSDLVAKFDAEFTFIETDGSVDLARSVLKHLQVFEDIGQEPNTITLSDGSIVSADQFSEWEVLAAEVIEGQNQLLWRNLEAPIVSHWMLDDNWKLVSSALLDIDTSEVAALFEQFSIEPDGDRVAQEAPATVVEEVGQIALIRNSDDQMWVSNAELSAENLNLLETAIALKFNGSEIYADQFSDWALVAADRIEGKNQLLWQNVQGQQLSLWTMDETWGYASSEAFSSLSERALSLAEQFNVVLSADSSPRYFSNNVIDARVDRDSFIDGGVGDDLLISNNGSDVLTGGIGSDIFSLSTYDQGRDVITDFDVDKDTIWLSTFDDLGALVGEDGTLNTEAFTLGAIAATSSHRILYDAASGILAFDPDGTSAQGQTQIATLGTGLALTSNHFSVYSSSS